MRYSRRWLAVLLFVLSAAITANAQKYEVDPYAGGFFPGPIFGGLIEANREGIFGVKGGAFLSHSFEAEGNFGYIANLSFKDTLTKKKAYVLDGGVSYHIVRRHIQPYVSFSIGRVITTVSADTEQLFPGIAITDRFLSLTYGGGVKVPRQWGRVGYRIDVRGRTLPNYYDFPFSWLEATAGITLSFGER